MKILLSNDDGVNAPGIRCLFEELSPFYDTTIIAPSEEKSTTGHSLSLDKPLRLERQSEKIYGCSGFPADCILLGLGHVMKSERPDLIISGINRGANLGQDLYYSGTIAAAREGVFHNVPSMAVSLAFDAVNEVHLYQSAAIFIKWCVDINLHKYCPPMSVVNVNVPNLEIKKIKGCRLSEIGFRRYSEETHARIDTRGREYFWIAGFYQGHAGDPSSDCMAIDEGYIAVTLQPLIDKRGNDLEGFKNCIKELNAKFSN